MQIDIDQLYKKYGPMVLRRCQALLNDEDNALDAMQEVFVLLIRNRNKLEDRGISSLLYTMATNHCLNVLKAKRRVPTQGDDYLFDQLPTKDRAVEAFEAREILEEIFSLHDGLTRTIAWLHFVDGLTLEETARTAGMSVSGIRKRLHKLQASATTFAEALA